jgi:toxin ParE1/3/4
MAFRLANRAVDDLLQIWSDGTKMFGLEQAERYHDGLDATFRFLAENPRAARLRPEIIPPVRAHPFKVHLVVYEVDEQDDILILRVRHGREDWVSDPLQDIA